MSTLVYLFGPPGVGKSTVMKQLTQHCHRVRVGHPLPRILLMPPHEPGSAKPIAVELGCDREDFPGTDCLSYSIMPIAVGYLSQAVPGLILGEGDRLANMGFFRAARDAGHHVHVVYLYAPPEILEARHSTRGARQNPAWRAGRITKARNLAAKAADEDFAVTLLDGTAAPEQIVLNLVGAVPVLRILLPADPAGAT